MKIKPNQHYLTRDGRLIFVSDVKDSGRWPVSGNFSDGRLVTFTRRGRYQSWRKRSDLDLVARLLPYPTGRRFRDWALGGLAVVAGTFGILVGGYYAAVYFSTL